MTYKSAQMKIVLLVVLAVVLGGLLFRDVLFARESRKAEVTIKAGLSHESLTHVMEGMSVSEAIMSWMPPAVVQTDISDPMTLSLMETDEPGPMLPEAVTSEDPAGSERGTPVQLDGETPVFWVKGIVYSRQNRSTVILDDGILCEGDTIYDATVIRIEEHAVTFEKSGKTYCVAVGQHEAN